ncbi:hypothetical protein [Merismopedia glauca]|nr:hypothetical protein [Merismopedia glauca]
MLEERNKAGFTQKRWLASNQEPRKPYNDASLLQSQAYRWYETAEKLRFC